MKNKIIGFFTFSLLTIFTISCKKFVTVPPPVQQLVTPAVFGDANTATAAQLAIYSNMQNLGLSYKISQKNGLLADEFKNYSSGGDNYAFYLNNIDPSNFSDQWILFYPIIYQANSVIEGLQKTNDITPAIKQQLIGEAKFSRAFCFFYLAATYGAVPIPLTTDYKINASLPRSPESTVYAQSINDLIAAKDLLNNGYVDASDTTVYPLGNEERVRPTKSVASALLARLYLYQKDYVNAAEQASEVINNTVMYNLETDLNNVFLANSHEAIWQLMPSNPSSSNTPDAANYILLGAPTGNQVTISQQLMNIFEAGDQRKINWISSFTTADSSATYYFPYKYKNITSSITEYLMVLRLAEQYLIRAEAEAYGVGGGLPAAVNDLNVIRKRAGLNDYSGSLDKNDILAAILRERQVELFSEWGHRWYDLRRTGTINAVMSVVTPLKGGAWNPDGHQVLYPIPQSEFLNDRNLTQNPGY